MGQTGTIVSRYYNDDAMINLLELIKGTPVYLSPGNGLVINSALVQQFIQATFVWIET